MDKGCIKSASIKYNSTGTFQYLYHSASLCLQHEIPILTILHYNDILLHLLHAVSQSVCVCVTWQHKCSLAVGFLGTNVVEAKNKVFGHIVSERSGTLY